MEKTLNENNETLPRLVFKMWRFIISLCLKNHRLCPSHYLRTPGLSWDAMLEMTKIELELIPDPDMYIFLENGTRFGISWLNLLAIVKKDVFSKSILNIQ